jgi:hypothetical protein
MFGLNLKLVLGLALLAVIGGLITIQHFTVKRLNAATARANQAEANYTALQEAQKHERKIAKEASDGYEKKLADLRNAPAIGHVRLCKRTTIMPATTTTTGQPDEATGGRVEEPHEENIGPAIDGYVNDCEAVAARLDSLQGWVRAR